MFTAYVEMLYIPYAVIALTIGACLVLALRRMGPGLAYL